MLKIVIIVLFCFYSNQINAVSYANFKRANIVEKKGYKPYQKILNKKQVRCLTENIYFEAGNQEKEGKKAVALVTLNRVNNRRFPKTICSVVYQRTKRKCQFSWVCNPQRKIKYWSAYNESEKIAQYILANYENINDLTMGATFFHRNDIKPPWKNPKIKRTVSIGKHIFYKL